VNPEVTVGTPHPYTRTGEPGARFGIPYDEAPDVALAALGLPQVRLVGLDMHVGSQVLDVGAWRAGAARLRALHDQLRAAGASDLRYLDVGGGLAVTYGEELPTDVEMYAAAVLPAVRDSGLTLIVEPGRYLLGNAGVLLTRVLYRKRSGGREYVITDAGMTDLLRPSHYNAYHHIEAVTPRDGRAVFDVVGPVCEAGDFLALGREMGSVDVGDLLAVLSAGAYGFCMASNYNSRPRAAEAVVDGQRYAVVTRRETYADLVRQEPDVLTWRGA
jgi:diaminopimelate decarboxylase